MTINAFDLLRAVQALINLLEKVWPTCQVTVYLRESPIGPLVQEISYSYANTAGATFIRSDDTEDMAYLFMMCDSYLHAYACQEGEDVEIGENIIRWLQPPKEEEHCEECGEPYPEDAQRLEGAWHKESCSLWVPNPP